MNLLDLLAILPSGGRPAREHSPAERAVMSIALLCFPVLEVAIVLYTDLGTHPFLALVALPTLFVMAAVLLGLRVATRPSFPWVVGAGCAALCYIGGAIAFLMALFASFYAGF